MVHLRFAHWLGQFHNWVACMVVSGLCCWNQVIQDCVNFSYLEGIAPYNRLL